MEDQKKKRKKERNFGNYAREHHIVKKNEIHTCWSRMTAKANGSLEKVYGMPPFILHSISLEKISKKLETAITSGEGNRGARG